MVVILIARGEGEREKEEEIGFRMKYIDSVGTNTVAKLLSYVKRNARSSLDTFNPEDMMNIEYVCNLYAQCPIRENLTTLPGTIFRSMQSGTLTSLYIYHTFF